MFGNKRIIKLEKRCIKSIDHLSPEASEYVRRLSAERLVSAESVVISILNKTAMEAK